MLELTLFWTHLLLIALGPFIGLALPLPAVILLVIAHRLHFFVFDGCAFTALKKRLGLMPQEFDFLQYAFVKIFKRKISTLQSKNIDYVIASSTLVIALTKYIHTNLLETFILLASLSGFLIATYILQKKRTTKLVCLAGFNCEEVMDSKYSKFFGVPVEILGIFYYTAITVSFGVLLAYPSLVSPVFTWSIFLLTAAAFIFSLRLSLLQSFYIRKRCSWCFLSGGLATSIFLAFNLSSKFVLP